jgi:tRNA nucleotidyltransferase (CCA-adding enzyme)
LWSHVIRHFEHFLGELDLSDTERLDAEGKAERVAKSLFAKYYPNLPFTASCYVKVGSYGEGTATRPPSDLDMLFVLPWDVYTRIEALTGNKQSQLLQEVRRTLLGTFPNTEVSADGPAVVAPFQTYNVDIVPAFRFAGGDVAGQYYIADTKEGGQWRLSHPVAECKWLRQVDAASADKATHLIKMVKAGNANVM